MKKLSTCVIISSFLLFYVFWGYQLLRNLLIQHHKDKVQEDIEKKDQLKRKISSQTLHVDSKEITDQYKQKV